MKLKTLPFFGLLGLGVLAAVQAQDIKLNVPGQPAATPPAAATYTESQVLEVVGWYMGKNSQIDTFGFSKDQLDVVSQGFLEAAAGKDSPIDIQKIGPQVQDFVQKRQDAYLARLKQQNLGETAKFFDDLKKRPGIVVLPSGLCYEITKPGSGPNAKATDTVKAHYTGTLINGTVFDTSRQPRQPGQPVEPAEFPLDQVIPGWTEGLQKINKGGMIKLYIPPQLAYGDEGRPGIPPASTLIFDVEIIDIKPTPGPASIAPAGPK
jgi:FKBP-type peptidyl-prolyl cis-trans isomerase